MDKDSVISVAAPFEMGVLEKRLEVIVFVDAWEAMDSKEFHSARQGVAHPDQVVGNHVPWAGQNLAHSLTALQTMAMQRVQQ